MNIAAQLKDNIKVASIYGLIVGAAFWTPDIVIHGMSRKSFSSPEVRIITFLLPIVGVSSYYALRTIRGYKDSRVLTFISGILGLWITGPFFMTISSSFSEGGFSRTDAGFIESLSFTITATILFPIYTFMMSTYDGTLFALFIASGLIPLAGLNKSKA